MDDQQKNSEENKAKSVTPVVMATIIATLAVVGIMWLISSSSFSPSTQQQSIISNSEVNPSEKAQPLIQAPSQNAAPAVKRLSYYAPMTFPPNVETQRGSFVNSCTSSGGTPNYCNCSFDYLISNYGLIWLIEANANYEVSGVIPSQLHSSQQYCSAWNN